MSGVVTGTREKICIMIGVILNIRGVGKKGVSAYLNNLLRQERVDFIGLQETIKKDYSDDFFRRIDPMNQFSWSWLPSVEDLGAFWGAYVPLN
jgi:hypothetical protein